MTEAVAAVDFTRIEKWYKGKSLETLRSYVIPALKSAIELGYWPKGASRKVTAALNKQNVAISFARREERNWDSRRNGRCSGLLSDIVENRDRWWESGQAKADYIVHDMMFGHILRTPQHVELAKKLERYCETDSEKIALARARGWAEDFAPVAKLVTVLDSRRPIPTMVCKTLSPTVLKNVGQAMNVALDSIEPPEIEYRWEERVDPRDGTTYQIAIPEIKWPEGIRHNTSRFAFGTAHNDQCHACGHAIKNAFNWVPLVAKTADGPVSLWVGRDCAKKLFGCEVAGEADWAKVKK